MRSKPIPPNLERQPIRWTVIWQLGLSLAGTLTYWGFALTLLLIVFRSTVHAPAMMGDSLALLLMAAGFAFVGLLLLPSAFFAMLRLLHKPVPAAFSLPRPGYLLALLPLLVGIGYLAAQNATLVWIILPPIHILVIGIATLWMVSLGIRGLPLASAQQKWGIFSTGLVVAPILSLVLEFIAISVVGIIGIAYLGRDPGFAAKLAELYQRYAANPNIPLEVIAEAFQPYLMQPVVIYGGLVVVALLVPLIEELFKPIGVWLIAGSHPTPAQGFAAGILSGAGFALFENLTLSATSGGEWALVVVARIGTSILHIITTGLTGWALATAWGQRKYLQLGITYLTAVAIHALWNGLVILSIVPEFFPDLAGYPSALENIGLASPVGFLVLLLGSYMLLLGCNSALRRAIIPPVAKALQAEEPAAEAAELGDP